MSFASSHGVLFESLPEWRAPWKEFVCSLAGQSVATAFALIVLLIQPTILIPDRTYRYIELVNTPAPVNHQPAPIKLPTTPQHEARVETPIKPLLVAPAATKPKVETEQAPKIALATRQPVVEIPKPFIPRAPVQTNVFSTGSSATATTTLPPQKVQTGGFGDPNGIPAQPNNGRPVTIASAGSFDLPSGPGYGNGTGGSHGTRGIVASAGFGNGVAIGKGPGATQGTVQESGFGAPASAASGRTAASTPAAIRLQPAEILAKPTPAYTDEARQLKVEGEVLLEVVLEASGQVRITRLVRGLGHGLDENAVRAAQSIRFKPALRDGQPSDSTVILHIIFQLA
jgi:TonB family protein